MLYCVDSKCVTEETDVLAAVALQHMEYTHGRTLTLLQILIEHAEGRGEGCTRISHH